MPVMCSYLVRHACLMLSLFAVAKGETLEWGNRQKAWGDEVVRRTFRLPSNYCALTESLRSFQARCDLVIVYSAQRPDTLEFKFVRDNHQTLLLHGHLKTGFVSFDDKLYFADFSPSGAGCTIAAYNLASGQSLWKTRLHNPLPKGHSAYSNDVHLRLSVANEVKGEEAAATIIVMGRESYSEYVEVLDRQSGKSLALRVYHTGFGDRPSSIKIETRP